MKKPDFLIIGVQRGGTSSLFRYLMEHPQIASPVDKEIHFFDLHFQKGWDWYLQQFPFLTNNKNDDIFSEKKIITGEASPYYIFHPLVAQRVKEYCPDIKLIVLLRDPVDRAISHYHHCIRFNLENLPLKEALKLEKDRLKGELEKFYQDENYYSYNHQHLAYISRGKYIEQLKHWRQYFASEQFLILQSEKFYKNPTNTLKKVTNFLAIDNFKLTEYYPHNQYEYPQTSPLIIQQLKTYFTPYNQELSEYLEQEFKSPFS
ncbi:MAG: sulfotransferase domain-containing protein [Geminocystis sp. GBBB08]|nr:sulfotransferase domain-containing protein [Geminocystis sp. GBBB08]